MKEFTYTIQDPEGIHARPAGLLVKQAAAFPCKITIDLNGKSADASRIMQVMGLGAKQGMDIVISCDGEQEDEAAAALETFLKENL